MSRLFSRTDRSLVSRWWWTVDRSLLIMILIMMACGLVMVSAASPAVAARIELNEYHFIIRHIIFLVPSLGALLFFSFLPLHWIRRFATILCVGALIGVFVTLLVGSEIKGAQRWLHIFGFSVQPSEFLKPAFLVVSAWLLARQKQEGSFPGNRAAAALFAISLILLVMQPDMGMAVLITASWAVQIFLAGLPFFWIIVIGLSGILSLLLAYFFMPHFQDRMNRFLFPEDSDTYQIDRAMEAYSKGGVTGVGPGEGTIKQTIPDAHADFVFAVAGEEMGLIFLLFLIGLYGIFILRVLARIRSAENMFAVLAASGLITMFGLQAFIHMGANLHILPTKGMTLPFISYGGSSIVALGIAMGMLLGVLRHSNDKGQQP